MQLEVCYRTVAGASKPWRHVVRFWRQACAWTCDPTLPLCTWKMSNCVHKWVFEKARALGCANAGLCTLLLSSGWSLFLDIVTIIGNRLDIHSSCFQSQRQGGWVSSLMFLVPRLIKMRNTRGEGQQLANVTGDNCFRSGSQFGQSTEVSQIQINSSHLVHLERKKIFYPVSSKNRTLDPDAMNQQDIVCV